VILFFSRVHDLPSKWHDVQKGKISDYEKERVKRGARSRRRKVSMKITDFLILAFKSVEDIEKGIKNGWIKGFQKNFRNADGSLRREKLQISISNIPPEVIISRKKNKNTLPV
jgi:hypothetical protein